MPGRDEGPESFADDDEGLEPGRRFAREPHQSKVHLAVAHPLHETVGIVLLQGETDAGVRVVECGQRIEQRGDGARGHHADDEAASNEVVDVVHGVPHVLDRAEHGSGVIQRGRAGRSEGGRPCGPVDEHGAEITFELLDLRADPRLADVHAFGGPGEIALLGDGDEVLQLTKLHNCGF